MSNPLAEGLPVAFVLGLDSQVYGQRLTGSGQSAGPYTRVASGRVQPALTGAPTAVEVDAFFANSPLAASGNFLAFGRL